jgi:hypothetical protein
MNSGSILTRIQRTCGGSIAAAGKCSDCCRAILKIRHELYLHARARNPRRWSRNTRNWNPITAVTLNPERDEVIKAATEEAQIIRAVA